MRPPAGYEEPAGAWVAQFVAKHFGRLTKVIESQPIIGASSVPILKPDPNRFGWLIFNLSAGQVNLSFAQAAATVTGSTGFPVQPLGGGVSAQADEDGELTTYQVIGIASMAGSQLYVLEISGV